MLMRQVNSFYTPEYWKMTNDAAVTDNSPSAQFMTMKHHSLNQDQGNLKDGDRTFITRLKLIKLLRS